MKLYEYQSQGHSLTLAQITLNSIFLNFVFSITADFNISSELRWSIQDQWSSGLWIHSSQMSHDMTKPTKWPVRKAKTQISLGIRPVWSESSLSAWRKLGSLATEHSKDSDQTGGMPRLIWVFAGRTCHCVGFVMSPLKCYGVQNLYPFHPSQ